MSDENTLLERWRQGDLRARDELVAGMLPALLGQARARMGASPRAGYDSTDVGQEAVLNFLRWGPRFVPRSPAQLQELLNRIIRNEVIDQERRRGPRHVDSLFSSASVEHHLPRELSTHAPDRPVEREELARQVRLAMLFLDPDDRELLIASEIAGLDWAAVAREQGYPSADAARMQGKRAKVRLAVLFGQVQRGELPDETAPAES